MISTLENPIKFFEDYVEHKLQRDLEEFYQGKEILTLSSSDIIDKESQIIKILDIYNPSKHITYSFKNYKRSEFEKQFQISKKLIDEEAQRLNHNKSNLTSYIELLKSKIYLLQNLKTVKKIHTLCEYTQRLKKEVDKFNYIINLREITYSLSLIGDNNIQIAKKLNKLLSENSPPLIETEESVFIKAFTGKPLNGSKIKWLVIGKNKETSKSSLFYFLRELYSNKLLPPSIEPDLSKYIAYIFCNHNGFDFQNLKNSKSYSSTNPAKKETIDALIKELKK